MNFPLLIAVVCQFPNGDLVFSTIVKAFPITKTIDTDNGNIRLTLEDVKKGKFYIPLIFTEKGKITTIEAKCMMRVDE